MLFVTEPRIDMAVDPDDPVEPPLLPIAHDRVEAIQTMAGMPQNSSLRALSNCAYAAAVQVIRD